MIEQATQFFNLKGLMPHGMCLLWRPAVLWTMVVADALIVLAYAIIPIALVYFIRKRQDIEFRWVFVLFGAFIFACGMTHLINIIVLWKPIYAIQSIVLMATGIISIVTAVAIWPQIPLMLALPSPWLLEQRNKELQITQERLNAIFHNHPDPLFLLDENETIISFNNKSIETFGLSENELMNTSIHSLIPKYSRLTQQKIAHDHDDEELPLQAVCKDGTTFPVEISYSEFSVHSTNQYIISIHDVSELYYYKRKQHQAEKIKKLNKDLENQKQSLLESNKELESFSYSVSHDLRAPIRHMDGFLQLLVKSDGENLSDSGKRNIDIVLQASRKLSRLIDDLLSFSQLGRSSLDQQEVNFENLLFEIKTELTSHGAYPETLWKFDNLNMYLTVDRTLFKVALTNLLTNALKFSANSTPPEINIKITKENNKATVSIADNGIGFDQAHAAKIFDVFQRLHKASDYEGTGVGLAIVKRVIDRHNGEIFVESEINQGTTFHITLPLEDNNTGV